MKYVNVKRRNGKTTMIIHASYITGYPIITSTDQMAHFIIAQAKKMGLDIRVYSIREWKDIQSYHHNYEVENVLIDEAQGIIDCALKETLKANVVASTMSIPMLELIPETEKKENT